MLYKSTDTVKNWTFPLRIGKKKKKKYLESKNPVNQYGVFTDALILKDYLHLPKVKTAAAYSPSVLEHKGVSLKRIPASTKKSDWLCSNTVWIVV